MKKLTIALALILTVSSCTRNEKPASPPPAAAFVPSSAVPHLADVLSVTPEDVAKAKAALGTSFVGVIPCLMANEYHATAANAAIDTLKQYGIAVQNLDPEAKTERQIAALENYTAAGAKVVVMCVLDPKALASSIQEASGKGVRIVQFAGRESAAGGVSVAIDDAELGTAAGTHAAKLINAELGGKAVVAILDYPDLPNAVLRADAIEAAIKIQASNATIIGRFLGGTQEHGLSSMETALQAHPEINVVVSINDAGAYGAWQALMAAGKDPATTIIVAIDAEKKARELIKGGGMYRATVDTDPARTGRLAGLAAIRLLAGSTVPAEIRVPVKVITASEL